MIYFILMRTSEQPIVPLTIKLVIRKLVFERNGDRSGSLQGKDVMVDSSRVKQQAITISVIVLTESKVSNP